MWHVYTVCSCILYTGILHVMQHLKKQPDQRMVFVYWLFLLRSVCYAPPHLCRSCFSLFSSLRNSNCESYNGVWLNSVLYVVIYARLGRPIAWHKFDDVFFHGCPWGLCVLGSSIHPLSKFMQCGKFWHNYMKIICKYSLFITYGEGHVIAKTAKIMQVLKKTIF
jgi:hypothetical protein